MAKNNTSQKKTSYVGGSDQGTTLTPTTPSPSTVLGTLSNGVSITYGELSDIVGENSDAFNAALIQMSENQENQYEYSDDTYNDNNLAILKRLGESMGYTMDYNGQPTAAQYAKVANLLELYQLYFG